MAILATIGESLAQQGTVKSYTYFEGERQNLVFKGDRVTIQALYESYKVVAGFNPSYDSVNYEPSKGGATLTLSLIQDGQPVYELSANELSSPIESHEYFDSLTTAQVLSVKQAIEASPPLNENSSWADEQKQLYRYYMHGTTEYNVSQYVLRETKNVSKRSLVAAAYEDVNKISAPPDTATANTLIGAIPEQEWLKKSPVVRQLGNQRWQIITEWWGARKLSKILYGGSLEYTA